MTGPLGEKIAEWVSRYTPLHSSAGFSISALLSSYSAAEYGYFGYLVLLIRKQGRYSLRTSVALANVQKGSQALFRVFFVYAAALRMGLVRMTLYTYAIFIAGSQLLWVSPSKGTDPSFVFALLLLTVGYAGGQGSTSYILRTQVIKAQKKESQQTSGRGPEPPSGRGPEPPSGRGPEPPSGRGPEPPSGRGPEPPSGRGQPEPSEGGSFGGWGDRGAGERCPCHFLGETLPARESCVCLFSGEQYNWRPDVCPIRDIEEVREGGRSCCYHSELNGTKKENENEGPTDEDDSVTQSIDRPERVWEPKRQREIRNRIRVKLFAGKLPGAVSGTVLAVILSSKLEIFFKISTALTVIIYNLFFWMGAQCYELGEMEKYDIMDENGENGNDENQTLDALVPQLKDAGKVLIKLLPLWLTFASTCYLVAATADSFFIEQVDYLENNTQGTKIPTSVFYFIPQFVSFLTERACHYVIQRYDDEKIKARWARLLRISVGMVFSSFCCMVASLVAHRLDGNYNSVSMLWLLPQFLLWGMMKGIMEEGMEEFLYDHLDNEFQVQAVCGNAESVGNFLSAILTAVSPSSWVGSGNDISKSHLEYYYRMLAILTLSSTFFFTVVAIAHELQEKEDMEKGGKKG